MTNLEQVQFLNEILLNEMPVYKNQVSKNKDDYLEQRKIFRSLMNVRPPMPLDEKFIKMQDEFLKDELNKKDIVKLDDLVDEKKEDNIYLWQGDITLLEVDAIVNAANSALLGCFIPCHRCIDNAIHSAAGLQLRDECEEIMKKQGHPEKTGGAKITSGYNLPSKYVIHTVGPIISGKLTKNDCDLLESSYRSCLELAIKNQLKSIAFCCISTGEFHFPNDKAAFIAVNTVKDILKQTKYEIEVIFNVFKEEDYTIYDDLLRKN